MKSPLKWTLSMLDCSTSRRQTSDIPSSRALLEWSFGRVWAKLLHLHAANQKLIHPFQFQLLKLIGGVIQYLACVWLPTSHMFVVCAARMTLDYIFSWNTILHIELALRILWYLKFTKRYTVKMSSMGKWSLQNVLFHATYVSLILQPITHPSLQQCPPRWFVRFLPSLQT